ncbi:MAG: glycoside hydrolase [Ruminococcus sp.]|nr:glycoside hydrolase [Ruminococcus sp.]
MKKAIAAISALVIAAPWVLPAAKAKAADTYDMTVTVDMTDSGKAISPYIYGINQYAHQEDYKIVRPTAVRQGGNRMTAYNWETNASNAGSDWKHSSDDNLSKSDRPADCAQVLSAEGTKYGFDYKLTTLQLAGYVAADKDGPVSEAEAAPSDRWNKVEIVKGAPFDETPDLEDGTVYMDEYVNYIIGALGDSSSPTGIQGYSLDNEPALWSGTHSRIHPERVTVAELAEKSIAAAGAVKKLDPGAEIFGPALYGYTAYDHLADDDSSTEWETIQSENNYHWYLDCYLDQMKKASDEAGTRLLDVLDIHYYSESSRVGAEDRVQSVRTLYEKGFVENSWIGQWCQKNVPILPTVQASIDNYFPGTKLGVTEYNFGGEDDASGAIAQAEALGCYADQGVYFASLWGGSGFIFSGLALYTNYDGSGSSFGDTLLSTSTEDVSKASAYASVNSGDDSTVTVMVTNKDFTSAENVKIVLDGAKKDYKSAAVYAVYGDSSDIRLIDVQQINGKTVDLQLPALSAAMVVIKDEETDIQIPTEPVIETEVYDDPMSMINENGYVEIPITDPEHLKKIVITGDVASSAGSTWGSAGCAVCINAVDDAGTKFWTSKSYSLSLGTGSKATVDFDGTLKNKDDEVNAVVADGKVELQKWWDSSEKKELEQEDEITVSYTKVEVFYEYPAGEQTETAMGDANCDGKVDLADAVAVLQYSALPAKYGLTDQGLLNADVIDNGESGVNGVDALAIQMVDAKVITVGDLPMTKENMDKIKK